MPCVEQKLELVSQCDGLRLSALMTLPEGDCAGIVQLAHGMAEHKERYLPFMQFLSAHGYACVINDHRGHGGSVKAKDDLGFFYKDGAQALVEDLHQVAQEAAARFPGAKRFLFGHSMGSLAVRAYAKRYDDELDGLFVCGSPSYNPAAPAGQLLVRVLALLRGNHARSPMMEKMLFGAFNAGIPDAKSDFAWINSDEGAVAAYDEDELCGFPFTLNGYNALLRLMRDAYDGKGWKLSKPDLPVRFLSGGDDPCMMGEGKLREAAEVMRKVGYRDVQVKIYPGMRHEILNEPRREEVYRYVLENLEQWRLD